MPVPKRKWSRKRTRQRAANKGIKPKAITGCQTCQAPIVPHKVCQDCGYYKGIKILRTKTDRLYERGQAREAMSAKANAMKQSPVPASEAANQ